MKTRPITFPKTGNGEWTNAETGVWIMLHPDSGAYYVLTGGLPLVPTVGHYADYTYRSAALDVAKMYVENVARSAIVAAHAEALTENAERTRAWYAGHGVDLPHVGPTGDVLQLGILPPSAEVADGLVAEMTKGNHTRVWVANQLIERLGVTPSGAHAIIRSGGVANLADAGAAPVQFPEGTPEYETYADELRGELAAWATGRDPYPYTREA